LDLRNVPGDSKVSLVIHWAGATLEAEIGTTYCGNGNFIACPLGAAITHFNRDEYNAYQVALSSRVTGPVIASSGGWFIRFLGGTPNTISFTDMQIDHDTLLHVAIPYPSGTTFSIYAQAPPWCVTQDPPYQSWFPICTHYYRSVTSIDQVRNSWGDAYYFDDQNQLLHIRIISLDSFTYDFASYGNVNQTLIWNTNTTYSTYFSRGGVNLLVTGSPFLSVVIEATNCNSRCANLPDVSVPGVNGSPVYTGPPQTPSNYTHWPVPFSSDMGGSGAEMISLNWLIGILIVMVGWIIN